MTNIPSWAERYMEVLNSIMPDAAFLPIHSFTDQEWVDFESKMYHSQFRKRFKELPEFAVAEIAHNQYLTTDDQGDIAPIRALLASSTEWQAMASEIEDVLNRNAAEVLGNKMPECMCNFLYYACNKYNHQYESIADAPVEVEHKIEFDTDNKELYQWLYKSAGGDWFTDNGIFHFKNLEDMVFCKLLFTKEAT